MGCAWACKNALTEKGVEMEQISSDAYSHVPLFPLLHPQPQIHFHWLDGQILSSLYEVFACISQLFRQTSQKNLRHMKSVKIGASLALVFILSFTPGIYGMNTGRPISGYFRYTFYINNLANFFIYLVVDDEFRAKLRAMFGPGN